MTAGNIGWRTGGISGGPAGGGGGRVYAVIRQAVVDQAMPPGTRLPEDDIGARFGVGRTIAARGAAAPRRRGGWSR